MNDDIRRRTKRFCLKAHSHPAVRFIGGLLLLSPRFYRICVDKKLGARAPLFLKAFLQQRVFVIEHTMKPMPRYITVRRTINCVAARHVISRHRLGYRPSRTTNAEKPTGTLLPRPDLR